MSNTDQLIASLSRQVVKGEKKPYPARVFLGGVGGLAIYVAVIFFAKIISLRPDIMTALARPLFAAEMASLGLLLLATLWAASLYAFPDCYQKRHVARVPVAAAVLFALILIAEWIGGAAGAPGPGIDCLTCIAGLSVLPAIFMFYRMRRMATLYPDLVGLLCSLCAFGLGALILRLSENNDNIAHLVLWHYAPMLGISFLGFRIGPRLLRW